MLPSRFRLINWARYQTPSWRVGKTEPSVVDYKQIFTINRCKPFNVFSLQPRSVLSENPCFGELIPVYFFPQERFKRPLAKAALLFIGCFAIRPPRDWLPIGVHITSLENVHWPSLSGIGSTEERSNTQSGQSSMQIVPQMLDQGVHPGRTQGGGGQDDV